MAANTTTYFGDVLTLGNTIVRQNFTSLGPWSYFTGNVNPTTDGLSSIGTFGNFYVNTSNSTTVNATSLVGFTNLPIGGGTAGANLTVQGTVWASNAIQTTNIVSLNVNTTSTNTTSLVATANVGIMTGTSKANVTVQGNLYVSNALTSPSALVTTWNSTTLNVLTISTFANVGGIGASLAALGIQGNVWASNAIQTTNISSLNVNVTSTNTTSLVATSNGAVGGPLGPATLNVSGNVWSSNVNWFAPNLFAVTANVSSLTNVASLVATSNGAVGGPLGPATLNVSGNVWVSNALQTNIFTTTANTTLTNTQVAYILSGGGSIGAGPLGQSNLYVAGNVWASNTTWSISNLVAVTTNASSISNVSNTVSGTLILGGGIGAAVGVIGNVWTSNISWSVPNAFVYSTNTQTINVVSIAAGLVVGSAFSDASSLKVIGNVFQSNVTTSLSNITSQTMNVALTTNVSNGTFTSIMTSNVFDRIQVANAVVTTNLFVTNSNVPVMNVTTFAPRVGVMGPAGPSTLTVTGNIYASNTTIQMGNLLLSGNLTRTEDLSKRTPHMVPSAGTAQRIQAWIAGQSNVGTTSLWSRAVAFSNVSKGPTGASDFSGAVFVPDGSVVFVPQNASNAGIWNQQGFTLVPTTGKFTGGVLTPQGNVVMVPSSTTGSIGLFNPALRTFSTFGPVTNITNPWAGGVLTPDGNVVMIPQTTTNVGVFSPSTLTFTNVSATSGFFGGVLVPNGNVIMVPNSSSVPVGVYNPVTQGFTTVPLNGTPSGWAGGVLAPNGNVIFVPGTNSNIGVFNPSSGAYSNVGAYAGFSGGALTPSGSIIFVPLTVSNIGMFNPTTLIYSNGAQATGFSGGALTPSGSVVMAPSTSTNVGVLNSWMPAPREFCLVPYLNKF